MWAFTRSLSPKIYNMCCRSWGITLDNYMTNIYKKAGLTKAQCPPLADIYLERFGEKTDGVFVEVGAFNGFNWSATFALAKLGWGGLLFEPQKDQYNQCRALYADNPRISVENCAILDYNGKTKLYLGGSLSTTSEERLEIYQDVWWAKSSRLSFDRFVEVPAYTLDFMLNKHTIPAEFEVLIIDVEGAETKVLQGFAIDKWRPQIMMIETHEELDDERLSATAGNVSKIVFAHGYEKVYSNYINTVYWRKDE